MRLSMITNMSEDKPKWNTKHPFEVPDGYFEEFDARLMRQIDLERPEKHKIGSKLSLIAPWIGMAAAFLIIALLYKQLPERIYPGQFNQETISNGAFFNFSPGDYYGEHELLEIITEKGISNIEIMPDSILFKGIDDEDLIMLTLFY